MGRLPLSNKPMKRTKAVSSRSMFNEPGPRGSTDERRAPRGPGSATIDEPIRPSPLIGKSLDKRGRSLGHWSSGGDGDQLSVALLLSPVSDRLGCGPWPQDSAPIAGGIDRWNFDEGVAPPPPQSWCGKQSLAPASVALAPTSSRGRLISLSCHLENAATGASVTDMGNHQGSSTNSFCFLAEISAVGGIDCATMAGEVWWGGSRCPTSR